MIQVRGLVRSFGPTHALRGVDLDVADGESLTILGPNGAGKTTFLRILATLLRPTEGEVRINGTDLHSGSCEARKQLGFSSHDSLIYDDLSVEENLRFYGKLYGISKREERVQQVLRLVGLRPRRHSRARTLSRGMQQRLSLARAILHEPPILLLDEPYSGLDQEAARMLEELLAAVRAETRTVVMTTHDLERGLSLSDRICILSKGRVAYEANSARLSLSELRGAYWEKTQEASRAAEGGSE